MPAVRMPLFCKKTVDSAAVSLYTEIINQIKGADETIVKTSCCVAGTP